MESPAGGLLTPPAGPIAANGPRVMRQATMNPPTLPDADPRTRDRQSEAPGVTQHRSPTGRDSTALELARGRRFGGERIFRWLTTGSGITVLVVIVAIGYFLIAKAVPALRANTSNFL